RWVGHGSARDGSWRPWLGCRKTMNLPICTKIKSHHKTEIIDALCIHGVRPRGCIDRGKSAASGAIENEPWNGAARPRILAHNVAVIVNAEGVYGSHGDCQSLNRTAVWQEERRCTIPTYHIPGAVDPECDLAGAGIQRRRRSRRAGVIDERRRIIH